MEKKIAIGIRATPSVIHYCITQENEDSIRIHVIDKVTVPIALEFPEQLKFLRSTFLDILEEFGVNLACIRATEGIAYGVSEVRIGIEAVIQELFASSQVAHYYIGTISSIASKLKMSSSDFKPFVEGKEIFMGLDNWSTYNKEIRESIMTSFSALNLI